MPPPQLAPKLPRLPPILHNSYQNPTSSCSKGPRGLSVLMQLTSIFTRTSISPGLWLRQWESRYAIRAGRNFVVIPSFEGDRLCLHLCDITECREPAYCPSHRFAIPVRKSLVRQRPEPHPEGISRYGAIPHFFMRQRASHGIPRRLTSRPCGRDSRCGLRRYERVFTWDHSHAGQISYPTRNFAEHCYNRSSRSTGSAGRSFPPASPRRRGARTISSSRRISSEMVGVWSLRILWSPESFLLIFRTSHIVTAIPRAAVTPPSESRVVEDSPGFPAYGRLRTASSPTRGAAASSTYGGVPTLGTCVTRHSITSISSTNTRDCGLGHFCLAPHVAMGVGLYLHLRTGGKSPKRSLGLACSL